LLGYVFLTSKAETASKLLRSPSLRRPASHRLDARKYARELDAQSDEVVLDVCSSFASFPNQRAEP